MSFKNEITSEFKKLNREVNSNNEQVKEQNIKIHQIKENLTNIEEKTKITNRYLNGFTSFFGFFPNLFRSNKSNKKNKENKNSTKEEELANNPIDDDKDELEKDIEILKQNATIFKQSIETSLKGTDELNSRIESTVSKVEKCKIEADKALKNNV